MNMNHLFVVRHGYYGDDGPDRGLTPSGQKKIQRLAERMKEIYAGSDIAIVSSPLRRADESAQIIADTFGLTGLERDYALKNEGEYLSEREVNAIHNIVELRKIHGDGCVLEYPEAVALVGHMPTATYLKYFARQVLGTELCFPDPKNGEAVYLNCISKKVQLIS